MGWCFSGVRMSGLRILSWNVNGIRAVQKKGFLEWLAEESPDIFCLQETKASEEQLASALKNIPGYDSYFASAERKGYSGVAKAHPYAGPCSYNKR